LIVAVQFLDILSFYQCFAYYALSNSLTLALVPFFLASTVVARALPSRPALARPVFSFELSFSLWKEVFEYFLPKMNVTVAENVDTEALDDTLYAFTLITGGIAIYNSMETMFLIFTQFTKYKSLYFKSLVGCAIGIFLFAVGFLDLFFKLYEPDGSIWRPLVVLTIGWYGMVTGFAIVVYSRLSIISVPPRVLKRVKYFIIYNVIFSHFPTTTMTFGANIIGTPFWVDGYDIIEKIQMTSFCIQVSLV
jgi:hypothetical protein